MVATSEMAYRVSDMWRIPVDIPDRYHERVRASLEASGNFGPRNHCAAQAHWEPTQHTRCEADCGVEALPLRGLTFAMLAARKATAVVSGSDQHPRGCPQPGMRASTKQVG